MRHVGMYLNLAADDPHAPIRIAAFRDGLKDKGWTEGTNLQIEYRFGADTLELCHANAAEMVALAPDVIYASSGHIIDALQRAMKQAGRSIPIVFAGVIDPVGTGKVDSLTRPGGNATGFGSITFAIGAKWLELLKQMAPHVKRVMVLRDSGTPAGMGQFRAMQDVTPSPGVQLFPIDLNDAGEFERTIAAFAREPNGGLIVTVSTAAASHRDLIASLVARHRLPAVFPNRIYGGALSYGPITADLYRHAAGYIDRILNGEKPADLPVQAPAKYELVINLRTAKALGIDMPRALLAVADEVIE
jgi:putative tryptophan/tyrosine transport system substrate-binding protein